MTYNSKLQCEDTDALFEAILTLKNVEECYRFFEDIATISEIKAWAQRLQVAKMLINDETYSLIAQKTGASTATISRVNKCLNYGSEGYKLVLRRTKSIDRNSKLSKLERLKNPSLQIELLDDED